MKIDVIGIKNAIEKDTHFLGPCICVDMAVRARVARSREGASAISSYFTELTSKV